MSPQARVEELLEEVLSSGLAPEQVCASTPELLDEVRRRWRHVQEVEALLGSLLPASDRVARTVTAGDGHDGSGRAGAVRIPGYEIVEVIGSGGMGIVYRAIHGKLQRAVAIKMLLADSLVATRDAAALEREARAIAALRHPNIVQVHDTGEIDGRSYFTMELMEGGTLARALGGVPRSVEEAAATIASIAGAVDAAHRSGIVHRDLKPGNVLLASDGTPKVSDFGLAMRVGADGASSLTTRGARAGTPSYMAPEQASGDKRRVGPAADIYALGATLYEMLTGRPPFRGESVTETERQLLTQDPVAPSRLNPRVPRDLETICLACLRKEPARRYASAAAMLEDVQRFRRGEPIRARRVSAAERAIKWARRHPARTTALCAASVFVVSACAAVAWLASSRAVLHRAADADLREAVRCQQQSDWAGAERAIERAALRLGTGGPAEMRQRLERARSDSALAAELIAIRMSAPDEVTFQGGDFARAAQRYADAFRAAGLVDPSDDPQQIATRIAESNIEATLLVALDDWALASIRGARDPRLLEIIRRTSPSLHGWRGRALDLRTYDDPALRAALMAEAPITRESLPLLNTVGWTLARSGTDAVAYLKRIQEAYPDDFWSNEVLATAMFDAGNPTQGIAYERAAVALEPQLAWVHYNLAGALAMSGDRSGAEVEYRKVIELEPSSHLAHAQLAYLLMTSDRWAEALAEWTETMRLAPENSTYRAYAGDTYLGLARDADAESAYRRALELDPELLGAQAGLRRVLLRRERSEEAIALWQRSIDAHPDEHEAWDGRAEQLLFLGRSDDYRDACRRLLARFGDARDAGVCERTGRACLLLPPESDEDLQRATALIDRAVAAALAEPTPSLSLPYYRVAKGLAEYRAGRYDAALAVLTGDAAAVLQPAPQLIAAMARQRLGELDAARAALGEAIAAFDWSPQRAHGPDQREVWIYHILRREAESLVVPRR